MSTTPTNDTLATKAGILTYLRNTVFASHTVDSLSGGYGNFTYRIHLHAPVDGMLTFVLKYTPPYAAASANTTRMLLSQERQIFEVEALRLAHRFPVSDGGTKVTTPVVRLFDEEAHVMIIDDAGSDTRTLKDILINETLPEPLPEEIGTLLGRFISHVHGWNEHPQVDLSLFANNEVGKMVSAFLTYDRLVSTLTGGDKLPHLIDPCLEIPEEKLKAISKLAEARIKEVYSSTASGVMTHGDFWPGNIMVSLRRGADGRIEALERLYVLDWEVAKTGLPGLDLGQLCAELHLVGRFHPHREESTNTTIKSFLSAYRQNRAVDPAIAHVTLSHIGAHLVALTPRIPWGGRERTREVVQEGVELLELSETGSESSLLDSIVGPLLSG
ncbi:kinase-like domain-containing protein [Scleroderma yunnanense]